MMVAGRRSVYGGTRTWSDTVSHVFSLRLSILSLDEAYNLVSVLNEPVIEPAEVDDGRARTPLSA